MSQSTAQVKLDFDRMTESGLKPLIKKFESHKLKVVSVDANNRAKRESGFLVKTAVLEFESGQKVTVRVKADGTVFQVKINARVLPIRHVDNMKLAIIEIVDALNDNEKSFAKARERRELAKKLNIDRPEPIRTTRKENIEKTEARIAELEAERDSIQEKIDNSSLTDKNNQLGELTAELETLQERGKALETELKTLKAEAA